MKHVLLTSDFTKKKNSLFYAFRMKTDSVDESLTI